MKHDGNALVDYSGYVRNDAEGRCRLNLAVEGMHCAGCAMKIERALNANDHVQARVNVTRRHLSLVWDGDKTRGNELVGAAGKLGFGFSPVAEDRSAEDRAAERFLLRCIAVSGFAAGNIMIFSLALWFSNRESMGAATQNMFHWYSALIALPTVVYAGQPFFRSAWRALSRFTTNMDVPISVGVILSTAMSLFETLRQGEYIYFDSAVMLLFLLLSGRYLDQRARGRARAAAQDILALTGGVATLLDDGIQRRLPAEDLQKGMHILVANGEKVLADGTILSGGGDMDTAAITGETLPRRLRQGDSVLAGMLNLGQPLTLHVDKASGDSMLADIARLMEKAEQGNAAYVRIADRVAGWYTPAVHALALLTFLGWWLVIGIDWQPALMNAVTVLIITCPCALGLAVPVVQVLASQWLFRRGMLVKSADALERLEKVDTVIFDKTGTLTTGELELENAGEIPGEKLALAAALASQSRHPLSRAIAKAYPGVSQPLEDVQEIAGEGIAAIFSGHRLRLGSRSFCGIESIPDDDSRDAWFRIDTDAPVRLLFYDRLRADTADTISKLNGLGLRVVMLSGDRSDIAQRVASETGIAEFYADIDPRRKLDIVDGLVRQGKHVLMVGDGLNDAPSLARASVSMSPSSAMHITQNAADIVFQGDRLMPVYQALRVAAVSQRLVRQNFATAFIYNIIAVPLAVAGMVTPLIAAVAMSASSLAVTFNALRLNWLKD